MHSADVSFLCSLHRWGEDFVGMEMKWQVISVHLCWENIRCLPCPALWTNKTPVSRAVNQEPLKVGNALWKTSAVEPPSGLLLCRYVLLCKNRLPIPSCKAVPALQFFIRQISLGLLAWRLSVVVIFWRQKCRFCPDDTLAFLSPSNRVTSSTKVTASQSGGVEMTSCNEFWLPGKYLLSMSNLCPREPSRTRKIFLLTSPFFINQWTVELEMQIFLAGVWGLCVLLCHWKLVLFE